MKIDKILAREILDSRSYPTIEVELIVAGCCGRAAIPSGASTGIHEALELRDGGQRLSGKGVQKAVSNVLQMIAPALQGKEFASQAEIDCFLIDLDGTENKEKLGANAILSVSLAFARAVAQLEKKPLHRYIAEQFALCQKEQESKQTNDLCSIFTEQELPIPFLNVLNGGVHADNNIDFQEFMIAPVGFATFRERLFAAAEVYQALRKLLKEKGYTVSVGDEGGFAPNLQSEEEAVELLVESIQKAGFVPKKEVALAMDVAASSFGFIEGKYTLPKRQQEMSAEALTDLYEEWLEKYPILSLEDPLFEEDWAGWAMLTERLSGKVQIVGDDIFVTNPKMLRRGIREKCANAVLIKLNQIGTLTETLKVMALAQANGYHQMVSHRSGETEDPFIAHLVVGTACGQIKTGAPARGERTAKYNELLRIAEE